MWVLAFQLFRWRHPQMRLAEQQRKQQEARVPWRILVKHRQAWAIFFCRFFADPVWYFYVFWIPEFLARERGLSLTAIAAVDWIPFLVSDISNFTTGLVALHLERRGWSVDRTRKALMLAGAAVSPSASRRYSRPRTVGDGVHLCGDFLLDGVVGYRSNLATDFFLPARWPLLTESAAWARRWAR
jgi:hypothetical protein